MSKSLIFKAQGGGAKLRRDTINLRVKYYIERKLHTNFDQIDPEDRQDIIFVLVNKFEYNIQELIKLFKRSKSTLYSDMSAANFMVNRIERRKKNTEKILDYILYNARYIP